jgi:methionyl-tRNA formyltransferase
VKVAVLSRAPVGYPWKRDRCLANLIANGHEVVAVVVEKSRPLGFVRGLMKTFGWRLVLQKAWRKLAHPPVTSKERGTTPVLPRIVRVDSHNDPATVTLLQALDPDLIVLRGCGIIKAPLLQIPRKGTINAHYGTLPKYRGMNVTEWSVLHGDPVGVTVHFVDAAIDRGAVLAFEPVPVEPGDSLAKIIDRSAAIAARLLSEVVTRLERGDLAPQPQDAAAGRQFFEMHPRIRRLAELRLAQSGR